MITRKVFRALLAVCLLGPFWSHAESLLELGIQAHNAGQWTAAYEYLVPEAQRGEAMAQYLLSRQFSEGLGVDAEPVTGLTLLMFAAQGRLPEAQYRLALHHLDGPLLAPDPSRGMHWLRLAAEQNHIPAQLRLAALLYLGRGGERDRPAAFGWYRRAAESGSREAQQALSRLTSETYDGVIPLRPNALRVSELVMSTHSPRIRARPAAQEPRGWRYQAARTESPAASERLQGQLTRTESIAAESKHLFHDPEWIAAQPDEFFTLQLFSSDKRQSAERVARRLGGDWRVTIFPFNRYGYRWYGVLAGSFEQFQEARAASERLQQAHDLEKPWIRRFRSIRKSDQ